MRITCIELYRFVPAHVSKFRISGIRNLFTLEDSYWTTDGLIELDARDANVVVAVLMTIASPSYAINQQSGCNSCSMHATALITEPKTSDRYLCWRIGCPSSCPSFSSNIPGHSSCMTFKMIVGLQVFISKPLHCNLRQSFQNIPDLFK